MNPQSCFFTDQIPLSRDDKLKVNTGGREREDLNIEGVGILYSSIQGTLLEPIFIMSKPGQPLHNPNLTSVNHVTWSLEFKLSETKNYHTLLCGISRLKDFDLLFYFFAK